MTPDTSTPEGTDDGQARPPLDERRARVLRAVVEEYVTTAQPVGSQTIATSRDLGVSSARCAVVKKSETVRRWAGGSPGARSK